MIITMFYIIKKIVKQGKIEIFQNCKSQIILMIHFMMIQMKLTKPSFLFFVFFME
jgi:hypothetical protein